ncbi:hypothetical protein SBC1_40680 (plasmid) [Caballeronia sp. SBC1]|nr:hypothetical protein SBC2_47260 [Caballeronia sp. SBC2]QIN64028.1 hypothetical protein SBC1_40680 [Caballeronia sp. SBC1]
MAKRRWRLVFASVFAWLSVPLRRANLESMLAEATRLVRWTNRILRMESAVPDRHRDGSRCRADDKREPRTTKVCKLSASKAGGLIRSRGLVVSDTCVGPPAAFMQPASPTVPDRFERACRAVRIGSVATRQACHPGATFLGGRMAGAVKQRRPTTSDSSAEPLRFQPVSCR